MYCFDLQGDAAQSIKSVDDCGRSRGTPHPYRETTFYNFDTPPWSVMTAVESLNCINTRKHFAISCRYTEKHFAISDNGASNAVETRYLMLSVAFGMVVRAAQQLAILDGGLAATAPGTHMVGIHLAQFPDARAGGIMADGAQGAVAYPGGL